MNKAQRREMEGLTPPEREELSKEMRVAKALKAKIKMAERQIRECQQRNPGKALIQILVKIRGGYGVFATAVAIARIERNQENQLSMEDRIWLEEQKQILLQSQPSALQEAKKFFCGS